MSKDNGETKYFTSKIEENEQQNENSLDHQSRIKTYEDNQQKALNQLKEDERRFNNETLNLNESYNKANKIAAITQIRGNSDTKTQKLILNVAENLNKIGINAYSMINKLHNKKIYGVIEDLDVEAKKLHKQIYNIRGKEGLLKKVENGENIITNLANIAVSSKNMVKTLDEQIATYNVDVQKLQEEQIKDSSLNLSKEISYIQKEIYSTQLDKEKNVERGIEATEKFKDYQYEVSLLKNDLDEFITVYNNIKEASKMLKTRMNKVERLHASSKTGKEIADTYKLIDKTNNIAELLYETESELGPMHVDNLKELHRKQESVKAFKGNLDYETDIKKMQNDTKIKSELSLDEEILTYATLKAF